MVSNNNQPLFIALIGQKASGKTSLSTRFYEDKFHQDYECTNGIHFLNQSLHINGKDIDIQVWDSDGNMFYTSVSKAII